MQAQFADKWQAGAPEVSRADPTAAQAAPLGKDEKLMVKLHAYFIFSKGREFVGSPDT